MTYAAVKGNSEALETFQKAVKSDPGNPSTYFNLAVQAERMNRLQEAIAAYQKFLELSDDRDFSQQRLKAKEAVLKLRQQ